MIRKLASLALLFLSGVAVLASPAVGLARGHGHGGGGHFGGGHFGHPHIGGFAHPHVGVAHGFYQHGYYSRPNNHFLHQGYRHHRSYGGWWGGYGTPYSGSYLGDAYPDYYGYDPDAYQPDVADATVELREDVVGDMAAHVTVQAPADAEIWFDGAPTTSTGTVRMFDSSPLTAGHNYSYEVRGRWHDQGRTVTQTQQVAVTPGAHVTVTFPLTPAATAASHK